MTDKWIPISEFEYPTEYDDERRPFLFYTKGDIELGYCHYCDPDIAPMTFSCYGWIIEPSHFMELPKPPTGD